MTAQDFLCKAPRRGGKCSFKLPSSPSAAAASGCGCFLGFYFFGLSRGGDRDFFAVIFRGANQLRLDAAAEALRRDNDGRGAKTQDPGDQFEFTTDMHLHRDSSIADLTHLLGGMPDTGAHILGNIGIEDDLHIEGVFFHDTKSRFEITFHGKIRQLFKRLACLFQTFNALDRECPDLAIFLYEREQIEASPKVQQPVWMDRVAFFLLAVNGEILDRKSTRLNSSHRTISYAVFCLKKKKKNNRKAFQTKLKKLT